MSIIHPPRWALITVGALALVVAVTVPALAAASPAVNVTAYHAAAAGHVPRHHVYTAPVAPVVVSPACPTPAAVTPPTAPPAAPEPAVTQPGFQGGNFNTHPTPPATTTPEPAVTLPGFNGGNHS